jgi:hypothetical protein
MEVDEEPISEDEPEEEREHGREMQGILCLDKGRGILVRSHERTERDGREMIKKETSPSF